MGDFTKIPRPFYPSLSSRNREIRLLHLQPGAEAEELQCRLIVASIDLSPSYEALSYCWGSDASSVLVDGHKVRIPQNLEHALRKMRFSEKERVLWADAICIDQSCILERNEQVALMADIYRKCERCLIWLGKTSEFDNIGTGDFSGNLPELLTALSKEHHLDQPGAPRINPMFGFTRIGLMLLNNVDWWNRIWVVQEVILAPKAVVLFGSFEMLWSDIVKGVGFINEHDVGALSNPNGHETDALCHCMDWIKVTFIWANLLELRDHVYRLLEVTRKQPETGSTLVNVEPVKCRNSPDILEALLSVRHRKSTDLRDKIFGILSLVEEWGNWEPIKADYSKDALQVYSEFATQMMQSEHGPKMLLLARGIGLTCHALHGLPTWAPDWSMKGSEYERHLITVEIQAPRSSSSQSASVLGSTLELPCGLSLGKIAKLSSPGAELHRSYGQPISMANYKKFTQMLEDWRLFAGVENTLNLPNILRRQLSETTSENAEKPNDWVTSGSWARLMEDMKRSEYTVDFMPQILDYMALIREYQDVLQQMAPDEDVFYRTIIHDSYPLHLSQPRYHREALCILRLLLIFYDEFADPDRFLTRVNSVVLTKMSETLETVQIYRKRLFHTDSGKLGIGPQEMVAGDDLEVFVFEGVERPFVLRSVGMRKVDGKGDQPCYQIVGHCYVDGLRKDDIDWQARKQIYLQ